MADDARSEAAAVLAQFIESGIQRNGERYAYDRCRCCNATWWGPRDGRENPEPERHNRGCALLDAREALARLLREVALVPLDVEAHHATVAREGAMWVASCPCSWRREFQFNPNRATEFTYAERAAAEHNAGRGEGST